MDDLAPPGVTVADEDDHVAGGAERLGADGLTDPGGDDTGAGGGRRRTEPVLLRDEHEVAAVEVGLHALALDGHHGRPDAGEAEQDAREDGGDQEPDQQLVEESEPAVAVLVGGAPAGRWMSARR